MQKCFPMKTLLVESSSILLIMIESAPMCSNNLLDQQEIYR